jgi:transglycosylase-like protein with SLT domain/sporulation related protein
VRLLLAVCALVTSCGFAAAQPAATESIDEALCRVIETAARDHGVAADFLTNLIWRESSFRARAVSPKGAQGIAQFMPYTARAVGLDDPFDPESAIPHAARMIADLAAQFGNLGLAAAAYNAGAGRVARWLAGEAGLPGETRTFVLRVTGRSAEDWAARRGDGSRERDVAPAGCVTIIAGLRRGRPPPTPDEPAEPIEEAPFAPWGVQLAGNFSKERALASFVRTRKRYASVLGDAQPMVIGTRLLSRGTRTFYRVRLPAETRQSAEALCRRIRAAGGDCVVLRS